MNDPHKPPMKIVPEASPPLGDDDQLQLDEALAALGDQLQSEARWLHNLAQDPNASTPPLDAMIEQLGDQLTREAQALMTAAEGGRTPSGVPRRAWQSFARHWMPLVAAASLLIVAWAVQSPNPGNVTPGGGMTDANLAGVRLPNDKRELPTQDAFRPSSSSLEEIPWQQLSSPELEGALDLVDEAVSISI